MEVSLPFQKEFDIISKIRIGKHTVQKLLERLNPKPSPSWAIGYYENALCDEVQAFGPCLSSLSRIATSLFMWGSLQSMLIWDTDFDDEGWIFMHAIPDQQRLQTIMNNVSKGDSDHWSYSAPIWKSMNSKRLNLNETFPKFINLKTRTE